MTTNQQKKTQWQKEKRAKNRKLIRRWKMMKGCVDCGYKGHFAALHLDHIDPKTKHTHTTGAALDYAWAKPRLKAEIAKCQVRCATCHAIRTYEERHYE